MGGDVAGHARVHVVGPRASQPRGLLQHRDVRHADLLQLDGHAQAGHARAHDHDRELRAILNVGLEEQEPEETQRCWARSYLTVR